ncbi:MAG: hypothetical protein LBK00_06730 [Treponema sp.]|nr:hypothetical protein [Treponema sp.]
MVRSERSAVGFERSGVCSERSAAGFERSAVGFKRSAVINVRVVVSSGSSIRKGFDIVCSFRAVIARLRASEQMPRSCQRMIHSVSQMICP